MRQQDEALKDIAKFARNTFLELTRGDLDPSQPLDRIKLSRRLTSIAGALGELSREHFPAAVYELGPARCGLVVDFEGIHISTMQADVDAILLRQVLARIAAQAAYVLTGEEVTLG